MNQILETLLSKSSESLTIYLYAVLTDILESNFSKNILPIIAIEIPVVDSSFSKMDQYTCNFTNSVSIAIFSYLIFWKFLEEFYTEQWRFCRGNVILLLFLLMCFQKTCGKKSLAFIIYLEI